jgi:hypothetical protein
MTSLHREYAGLFSLAALATLLTGAYGITYLLNSAVYQITASSALGSVRGWGAGMSVTAAVEAATLLTVRRLIWLTAVFGAAALGWLWGAVTFAAYSTHNAGSGLPGAFLWTYVALTHLSLALTASGYDRRPRPRD